MTISYTIIPKDANIITSPYADVTEKILPSIIFIADAGDLLPIVEPIVTVIFEFDDSKFTVLGEFFLPVGVDKEKISSTVIQYSGKFTKMSPLFNQDGDVSNVFLAHENTTFAGANFFQNIIVNVTVTDSVGTSPENESWQWTPPFVVTNNKPVLEYNTNTPRIFSDIFQFEDLQPTIDDNWNFEIFFPIYDHSQTLIGDFALDPSFSSPNTISFEDAIGPYSNLGQYFGTLGPNNDFFYEFRNNIVLYWTKEVEQLLDPSFVKKKITPRINLRGRGIDIENIYSADNKMFIYYKENKDLVDYFEFDGNILILKQTIDLNEHEIVTINEEDFFEIDETEDDFEDGGSIDDALGPPEDDIDAGTIDVSHIEITVGAIDQTYVRLENILDGNNSKIFQPSVYLFNNRLFVFAGIREGDSVEVYRYDGTRFVFESSVDLEFLPYRAVYWMSDKIFMYITHDVDNEDDPEDEDKFLHKPKLRIYRRIGTEWTILNEIEFFSSETIQNFRQNGITPFDRIITPGRSITEGLFSSTLDVEDFGFIVGTPFKFEDLGDVFDLVIIESVDAGLIIDPVSFIGSVSGIVSINDFFIIWFDSVQGDLYRNGGVTGTGTSGFEKIKTIDKSYPGYNYNNTILAFDSIFTLFPDDLSTGPAEFGYRLGSVSPHAFNILPRILVRDRQYWFENDENQGWVCHYTTFGTENSIFKFKKIDNVFWGSIKRGFINDLSFNDINELLRNLVYTQPIDFERSFPVYWTISNARDDSIITGDTFDIRRIVDLAFVTPAGIIGTVSELFTITSANLQVEAIDPTNIFAIITYDIISGALPPGASLNPSTGEITGFNVSVTVDTPFTFEIEATDGVKTIVREFTIVISNDNIAPIWSTPTGSLGVFSDEDGTAVVNLQVLATDSDGPAPVSYSLEAGTLPGGLSLNTATGEITGTLTDVTSVTLSTFTIRASDSEDFTDRVFSITVTDNNEPPFWNTSEGLLGTVLSTDPVNFLLVASDGDGPDPVTYTLTAGSLPTGASLNTNTGLISGPPIPTIGLISFDFIIEASDGLISVPRAFSIEITANLSPIWITAPGLIGTVTEDTLSTLSVEAQDTDGPNPVQYSILTGDFPTEFTLDSFTGDITGTARTVSADETFNFTIRATDTATIPADRAFSLKITNSLTVPVWITAVGSIGEIHETESINLSVTATDEDAGIGIIYIQTSGALPTGSVLNTNTGEITGPPVVVTTDTIFNFVIRAINAAGPTDRSFSITIKENLAPVWITPAGLLDNVDLGVTILAGTFTLLAVDPDSLPDPIIYSIVSGSLPPGITLNSNGDVVGTLGAAATANILVGLIDSISVTVPGNSYVTPPTVTILGGENAIVTATLVGTTVDSITVDFGGSGYIVPPIIVITGDGFNATATANISGGEVISVTITNGGTGYTETEINIGAPTGGGSGATAIAVLTADAVTSITVTSPGSGYTVATVAIEGPEALIGLYPFTARADDGLEFTDESFTFVVKSINLPPTFITPIGNIATFTEDIADSVTVIATDPNPDDLVLTYDIISGSLPLGLTLNSTTGEITGTVLSASSQVGDHPFTMRVRDRVGEIDVLEDTRSFTITVAAPVVPNQPPTFVTPTGNIASFTEDAVDSVIVVATDPDDIILTYDIISGTLPLGLSLNSSTGEISGTVLSTSGQVGDHVFTMRVRDPSALEDTRSFTITVTAVVIICNIWELDAAAFNAQSGIDDLMAVSSSGAEDIVLSTNGEFLFGNNPGGVGEERIYRMPLAGGINATATANLLVGVISSITINDGGSNYTIVPTVTIIGDGVNAAAIATIGGGEVTSITVTDGGSGYTVAIIEIDPPTGFTNWDLSTIQPPDQFFNYESAIPDVNLRGYGFNSSGTRMYISDIGNFLDRAVIHQFTLSAPWIISSAVLAGTLDVAPLIGGNFVREFHLVNGGVDLFLTNAALGKIQHMVLSVPDDITTAVTSGKELSVLAQTGSSPTGVRIGKGGTRLYTAGTFSNIVYQYNLLTPYDFSGTVTFTKSLDTTSELGGSDIRGIHIADDGNSLYVVDTAFPHSAYQYILCI